MLSLFGVDELYFLFLWMKKPCNLFENTVYNNTFMFTHKHSISSFTKFFTNEPTNKKSKQTEMHIHTLLIPSTSPTVCARAGEERTASSAQ